MSTRERIVEQAMEMYLYDGVKSIRMDDIATTLCMSKRTLYELFGDKETLLIECAKLFHSQINERQRLASKDAKNVIEELMLSLEQWETLSEQNHKLMSSLKKFYPKAHSIVREYRHKDRNTILKLKIEKGVEQGIFLSDIDLELAITLFTDSLLSIITTNENKSDSLLSHKDTFMFLIVYFLRGISTDKGIKLIESYRIRLKH